MIDKGTWVRVKRCSSLRGRVVPERVGCVINLYDDGKPAIVWVALIGQPHPELFLLFNTEELFP